MQQCGLAGLGTTSPPVVVVVEPVPQRDGLYTVRVALSSPSHGADPEVAGLIGPLQDNTSVSRHLLAPLVRATVLSAFAVIDGRQPAQRSRSQAHSQSRRTELIAAIVAEHNKSKARPMLSQDSFFG